MCDETKAEDPEILELCRKIISGQEAEIRQMETKLRELEKR